jgi:hypothetical protein
MFTDFVGGVGDIADISPIRSIRAYQSIIPYIRNAENNVRNITGQRQYDNIKSNLTSSDTRYKELIKLIRRYVVDFGLEMAIPVLSLYNNGKDLVLIGDTDGISKEFGPNSASHQETINIMIQNLKSSQKALYQEIKNYLAIHRDFFTLYAEDNYSETRSKSVFVSPDEIGGIMI